MWTEQSGRTRWLIWFGAYGVAVLGIALAWLAQSTPFIVADQQDETIIAIQVDHSHLFPRVRPCTAVSWQMEGIRGIYLNDAGNIGTGQIQTCMGDPRPVLRVILPDDTEAVYQPAIYDFPLTPFIYVLSVAFGLSLAFAVLRRPLPILPERLPAKLRVGILVGLVIFLTLMALGARTATALLEPNALLWDERYYASIAATTANGYGLYPHILGYEPMAVMGGIGQFARLYTLAYQTLGPQITNLRVVIVVMSLLSVWAVYATLAHLYGRGTGLVGVALLPSFLLFEFTNSIRMDAITFAFVGWALYLFVRRHNAEHPRWHLLIGFVFGLGLQAHLHTFATAFGVGFTYLGRYVWALVRRQSTAPFWRQPVLLFVGGYAVAFALFVVMNILPNPDAFFRTAGLARVSAAENNTALDVTREMDTATLIASFINPARLLEKEQIRYRSLILGTYTQQVPEFPPITDMQRLLWLAALITLFVRPGAADRLLRWVLVGSIIGGAIIFNSVGVGYLTHIGPVLFMCLAPLFTHGFRRTERVELSHISTATLLLLVLVWSNFTPLQELKTIRAYVPNNTVTVPEAPPQVTATLEHVSTGCHIAATSDYYVPYFLAYPRFTTIGFDMPIGLTYYGLAFGQEREYMEIKAPDVLLQPFFGDIQGFVDEHGYIERWPDVWVKPGALSDGCSIVTP